MQKEQLFEEPYSNQQSSDRRPEPKKRQHIKKDPRRKDKRKHQSTKPEADSPIHPPVVGQQPNNKYCSLQSEASKYQRLDEFWKVDIENLYRKEFTPEDKQVLSNVLNEKKPSILQVFKNQQTTFWQEKISLQLLHKYLTLIDELSGDNYTFVALQHQHRKEHYVIVLNKDKSIQKAVEVSQQELTMLAHRQDTLTKIKSKQQLYNSARNRAETLTEVELEMICLVNYLNYTKQKLDEKLRFIQQRANQQPKPEPPSKVEDNYISFLIRKNLKKALKDEEIDYFNHFKKLDITQHTAGLIDLKPITQKRDFDQYVRKRKLKKTGKKARWVLKTACAGCLSYHHEMYNPLSFCTECHVRYHKYCYIPKTQSICESCFLSKNNQSKRSRISECQLCGSKGFLYLPMDESNNAHIFCMLINGLWKFENTQIVFQKKYIQNAVQNVHCSLCKQSNSCIYKCECCDTHAHPLCAYLNGWALKQQPSPTTQNEIVKLQCCNGVEREKNEKNRRFVLNYKRCVFSQCE